MIRARLITARDDMFRQHKQEGKVAPIASQRGRSWRIMKSDVRLAMQLIGLDPIGSNPIGSYRIDRIPWCGKCRAVLHEATSRRAIRRLYQYRRYYWIAAVLGMVSIVIWQAPTKEPTPAYVRHSTVTVWNTR